MPQRVYPIFWNAILVKMESGNSIVKDTNYWNEHGPISMYLAMAIFVLIPFVGGWVGYTYAPEKIVEVTRVLPSVVQKTTTLSGVATRVTIETLPVDEKSLRGGYPTFFNYTFENGKFSVAFFAARHINIDDDYTDPNYGTSRGTQRAYYKAWLIRNVEGGGRAPFLTILVNEDGCVYDLCSDKIRSEVELHGQSWNYLGGYEYCDVGECTGSQHVYSRNVGTYTVALESDFPLHDAKGLADNDVKTILSSLSVSAQ